MSDSSLATVLAVLTLLLSTTLPFVLFYIRRVSGRIDTLFKVTEQIKDNYVSEKSINDKLKPIEQEVETIQEGFKTTNKEISKLYGSVEELNIFKAVLEKTNT